MTQLKVPCHKCLMVPVCRIKVLSFMRTMDFMKGTPTDQMILTSIELTLYEKCDLLHMTLFDDDFELNYHRSDELLEALHFKKVEI